MIELISEFVANLKRGEVLRGFLTLLFALRNIRYVPRKYWEERRRFEVDIDIEEPTIKERSLVSNVIFSYGVNRVLEVGCGAKNFRHLWNYLGVDFSKRALKGQKNVVCADVCHLPLRDKSFDMVISRKVLLHVPDGRAAVEEIKRVTRKVVMLNEPHYKPCVKLEPHCFNHDYEKLFGKEWLLLTRDVYQIYIHTNA